MDLKELISVEARVIDRLMREDLAVLAGAFDPLLAEILEYGLFSGGKRIRPLLAIVSSRMAGRDDRELCSLACAFEYLHVATLLHDDVIDRAESRRGKLSVNRRYGTVGAILAGDFLHAHAMGIVGRYAGTRALDIFTEATRGMVDGEFVQLRNSDNFNQSEDDYFTVVMGKTALLIGAACEIGALFGGADREQQSALKTYGLNLGCAFQIVDDLLDYLGDESATGKAVGNDFRERKMTLPLIIALKNAPDLERGRLLDTLRQESDSTADFREAVEFIDRYGGFSAARQKAEAVVEQALAALHLFAGEEQSKGVGFLRKLSAYVLKRNT